MQNGEVDISKYVFDLQSRDDIPKLLIGLQYIYCHLPTREALFQLLEERLLPPEIDKNNGRPGMPLWAILVCGVLRLGLNADYDRVHELANKHIDVRAMLGHGAVNDMSYHYQTLRDNVCYFTPDLLGEVNVLVVRAGHALVKKKPDEALRGRCDSFVVKTEAHFPTDVSLLYDAMRKVITLLARWCERCGMSDWRQSKYNVKELKKLLRSVQNKRRGNAKSDEKKAEKEVAVIDAYQQYVTLAQNCLAKAKQTLETLVSLGKTDILAVPEALAIRDFMQHASRQIAQIKLRAIQGGEIAHAEKVFSIFEPHTEWVCKGKAGVPVELGVKVCILEDQHQFILHHHVMQKQTDDKVAVSMVAEAKKRFPKLNACSFDKGFHSPTNQVELTAQLEQVTLPRKGKPSQQARAVEKSNEFVKARHAHSAVESAINALGVHGLDKCPDHGIDGFKRYVALAIVARNIHRIGEIIWKQKQQQESRKARRAKHEHPAKQAA